MHRGRPASRELPGAGGLFYPGGMAPKSLIIVSTLLACSSALADNLPATQRGYLAADAKECKVWGPSTLAAGDYIPHYTGPCVKGFAEGKGKVDWMFRYSEGRTKASWSGAFRHGVYIGDQTLSGEPVPMGGDRYLMPVGKITGGTLAVVATSPQDGNANLCNADSINVEVATSVAQSDDDAMKKVFGAVAERYGQLCKQFRGLRLQAFNVPMQVDDNGRLPQPFAEARLDQGGTPGGYSNHLADQARQKARQADAAKNQLEARKMFDAFSRSNHVTAWVTTEQLDKNPFKYEGQVVGVIVRMDRMLTRDTAVVRSGMQGYGSEILLQSITPDFPGEEHTVLLAAKVGKREPLPDGGGTFTALAKVDTRPCTRDGCSDWLVWLHNSDPFNWGEPYKPQD